MNLINYFQKLSLVKKLLVIVLIISVVVTIITVPIVLTRNKGSYDFNKIHVPTIKREQTCINIFDTGTYTNIKEQEAFNNFLIKSANTGIPKVINNPDGSSTTKLYKWEYNGSILYYVITKDKLNTSYYTPNDLEKMAFKDSTGKVMYYIADSIIETTDDGKGVVSISNTYTNFIKRICS